MSEILPDEDITSQMDSTNVICPYCNEEYQPESEDFSENERIETCDNCGKKYHLWQEWSIDHNTKPDCEINGEEHNFELSEFSNNEAEFCTKCDKCRLIKSET